MFTKDHGASAAYVMLSDLDKSCVPKGYMLRATTPEPSRNHTATSGCVYRDQYHVHVALHVAGIASPRALQGCSAAFGRYLRGSVQSP